MVAIFMFANYEINLSFHNRFAYEREREGGRLAIYILMCAITLLREYLHITFFCLSYFSSFCFEMFVNVTLIYYEHNSVNFQTYTTQFHHNLSKQNTQQSLELDFKFLSIIYHHLTM